MENQENINFHKITPLQAIMIDLQEHGQDEVWQEIEMFNNPFNRIEARRLMAKAMKKIKENNL